MHGWEITGGSGVKGLPSRIAGLDKLLGPQGWPRGSIISFVGTPKCGKTTVALQEAILQAEAGKEVCYVYNESPQARFMAIAHRHREELGIGIGSIQTMKFIDMHGLVMRSADYSSIEKFVDGLIMGQIEEWFRTAKDPAMMVIDSLSKFCRTYTAQAFYFAQTFTARLWKAMGKHGKTPVIIAINQKSGGHWEKDDDTVLGGMGIVHEMDGSVVFTRAVVDQWLSRDYGFPRGTQIRMVRVADLRDRDVDDADHMLKKIGGKIEVGESIEEVVLRQESRKPKRKEE
jgi:KaiC/GvpD/RAD55 family RecA-like ATPase